MQSPRHINGWSLRPTLLSALASVALLAACSGKPEDGEAAHVTAAGERLVVQVQSIEDLRPVSATYQTRDQADARARISGTLMELRVREGDAVRKGQVIAVVRDERLDLQAGAYDAQINAAAAESARAQADLGRTRDLYEHGVYAKARLEQVEAAAKAASAQLAAAKAQHAASANLAGQGTVIAPATGTVLHAQVPAGSVVMPGQSIATITAGPPVIRMELPEAQAAAIKAGKVLSMRAGDGSLAKTGPVTQIYPSVTAGAVTIDLAVPASAATAGALIGHRVDVLAPVGERKTIVVPKRFIATRFGVDYARILHREGSAGDVVVQTAATGDPASIEVLSGLANGDTIIAAAPVSGAAR